MEGIYFEGVSRSSLVVIRIKTVILYSDLVIISEENTFFSEI